MYEFKKYAHCFNFASGTSKSCKTPNIMDSKDCGKVRDIDCYDFEFHGNVSNALNGKECKTWTRHGWTDNLCRNDGYHRPWCYRKSGGWDYCDVRQCKECDKKGESAPEY